MEIRITLDGRKKVSAHLPDGQTVETDQPTDAGGEGNAPSPYLIFLAAIGTCAGVYVEEFCSHRGIPTEALSLTQKAEFTTDGDGRRSLSKISLVIHLPAGFPEKYRNAVVKAAELCAVKKAIMNPPEFEIRTEST